MKASLWTGAVEAPGLYLGTPMEAYRADPCPAPSLNASVARLALFRSPLHAKVAHPRLVEPVEDDEDETEKVVTIAMDIGSAAHALAFGVGEEIATFYSPNWKKKADQEAKKEARAAGQIPLLNKHYKRAKAMADISGPVINSLLEGSLVAEAMLVWQERGGLWRRGLIDRMRADARIVLDYKTTQLIASPAEARGVVYSSGHYFQEAFYRRGLDVLDPDGRGRRRFVFLYQEQEPPFTLTVIETDEAGRSWGEEQVEAACNIWDRALVTGEWPGYPLGPHIASPPPWLLDRWARRAEVDETLNQTEFA